MCTMWPAPFKPFINSSNKSSTMLKIHNMQTFIVNLPKTNPLLRHPHRSFIVYDRRRIRKFWFVESPTSPFPSGSSACSWTESKWQLSTLPSFWMPKRECISVADIRNFKFKKVFQVFGTSPRRAERRACSLSSLTHSLVTHTFYAGTSSRFSKARTITHVA